MEIMAKLKEHVYPEAELMALVIGKLEASFDLSDGGYITVKVSKAEMKMLRAAFEEDDLTFDVEITNGWRFGHDKVTITR